MPIYEYKCEACGNMNEFIVFSAAEELRCKSCGSTSLEKIISAHNTMGSSSSPMGTMPGGCCGSPNSCGSPGSCCGH